MQKEWSSHRITLLLYFIVLLLPVNFYFIYSAFETMKEDTTVVRKSSWLSGAMEQVTTPAKQYETATIERTLNDIHLWVQQNNTSNLYIGATSLTEDFTDLTNCWETKTNKTNCYAVSNDLAIIIEKMVYLKQKKIINIFYISLTTSMILILLTIYLIRQYIHIQMKKHAIHDHDTQLYNKKYFLTLLQSACAKSKRYEEPLSILWISLTMDDELSKKTQQAIFKRFGLLVHEAVRTSDAPAKYYDETTSLGFTTYFSILLPYTQEASGQILENRLRELLQKDTWMMSNNIEFKFAVVQFEYEELPDVFIARSKSRLKA